MSIGKQPVLLLHAIALTNFVELVVDLIVEEWIWIGDFVIDDGLFSLGCVFSSLLNNFFSDFKLRDVAASTCKLV